MIALKINSAKLYPDCNARVPGRNFIGCPFFFNFLGVLAPVFGVAAFTTFLVASPLPGLLGGAACSSCAFFFGVSFFLFALVTFFGDFAPFL